MSELCKITVTYDAGPTCLEAALIAPNEVYNSILRQWHDVVGKWVICSGRVDHIDANKVQMCIQSDSIRSVACRTINGLEPE